MITTVSIPNFNLQLFERLLNQSVMVSSELVLEIKQQMLKSSSTSPAKSLIKIWAIPLTHLFIKNENENQQLLFDEQKNNDILSKLIDFSFFVMKGDVFIKHLSVFNSSIPVTISFDISEAFDDENKSKGYEANTVSISGFVAGSTTNKLNTKYILTQDNMMSTSINDSSNIIDKCTPTESMSSFLLKQEEFKEIKSLITKLKGTISDNTSYLTVNIQNNEVKISDKVFEIAYPINWIKQTFNEISFNIKKEDFAAFTDSNLTIFVSNDSDRIIFQTKYGQSLITALSTKPHDLINNPSKADEEILADLDLSAYGLGDDLPF